jgi:hypothetical protein
MISENVVLGEIEARIQRMMPDLKYCYISLM